MPHTVQPLPHVSLATRFIRTASSPGLNVLLILLMLLNMNLAQGAPDATVPAAPAFSSQQQSVSESSTGHPPAQLAEVTVISTRTERRVNTVPNTVSVTTARQLEEQGAHDMNAAFRYQPDVTVRTAPTRFNATSTGTGRGGNESINIRGLEGNQVLMLVDGIRVPGSFSYGAFATGRGDYLDMDGVRSIEVLRGPTSTQFGSDGLAGAVSFHTFNPSDILHGDAASGGFIRSSYSTVDRSWTTSITSAGSRDQWQGMVIGSFRQGHETINQGNNPELNSNRTSPNPLRFNSRYLLGKATFSPDQEQQLTLAAESQSRWQNTEVYSARAVPPLMATSITDLAARDQVERDRLSLEQRYHDISAPWIQRAENRLYWQRARVNQYAREDRHTAPDRTRDNTYRTTAIGLSTLFETHLEGWFGQRITYGVDWSRTETIGLRDGTIPHYGETFPTRPFPNTAYTLTGLFVQSELQRGWLSLIPALRFDHYQLSPSIENGMNGTGNAAVALSGQAITPRVGVVWRLAPYFSPYGQIATGFRAPAPEQVNTGFTNLASGYTSIGNPNLKAEHANSAEIGFRGKLDSLRYSVAAFDNHYSDFISQQVVGGAGTPANPTVFQYVNLAKARIHGWETRAEWKMNRHWRANAGVAFSRGDSHVGDTWMPLNTIQPLKAVLGLRYDLTQWGLRANLVFSRGKSSDRIAPASAIHPASPASSPFAPPAYTVLDLGWHWNPIRNLNINATLNNVFNTTYWRWSDVTGLANNSTIRDAYTAPGRNAQVALRYDF